MLGEKLCGPGRLGPGDVEGVGEERREPDGRDQTGYEDRRPRDEDDDAVAENDAGPALEHGAGRLYAAVLGCAARAGEQ